MEEIQSVQSILDGVPYYGMIGVAAFATLFPGIPEEGFLLVIGYLIGTGAIAFWKTLFFLLIGFFIMDCALFALARRGTKVVLALQKKILGGDVEKHQDFIKKHVSKIIFFSRFALYIRWIGPVLAGSVHTSWRRFLVIDFFALLFYVPGMLLLGIYFRSRIENIISGVNAFGNIVVMGLVAIGLILIVSWGRNKFKQRLVATAHGQYPKRTILGITWQPKRK